MTETTDGTTAGAIPMDPDDVFTAISNSRRRQVILSLSRTQGPTTARDLATEIAAIEHMIDPSQVGSNERTSVYITLTQRHLEKLDDIGALTYQDRPKKVTPTESTEPLAEYIRRLETACYQPDPTDSQ